jgi:hypothetical protein
LQIGTGVPPARALSKGFAMRSLVQARSGPRPERERLLLVLSCGRCGPRPLGLGRLFCVVPHYLE